MGTPGKDGDSVAPFQPSTSSHPTSFWDHRPTGEAFLVHPFLHKPPKVIVKNHVIAMACHSHLLPDQRPPTLGGAVSADSVLDDLSIVVNSISNHLSLQAPGDLAVPVKVAEGPEDSNMVDIDQHAEDVERFLSALSSGLPTEPARLLGLRVSCSCQPGASVTVTISLVSPDTTFRLTPVSPVPVVGTSLARSLVGPRNELPSSGFLSLDADRRLAVLLPKDPSIGSVPLVGIWVSQVALPTHPLVWATLMAYVFPADPSSRLSFPPKPFLLALYSPLHPFPEFYDCVLTTGLPQLVCQHHVGVHSLPLPRVPMASHQVFSVTLEKTAHKLECHPPSAGAKMSAAMVNSSQPLTCPRPTDKNLVHHPQVPDMSLLSDSSLYDWRLGRAANNAPANSGATATQNPPIQTQHKSVTSHSNWTSPPHTFPFQNPPTQVLPRPENSRPTWTSPPQNQSIQTQHRPVTSHPNWTPPQPLTSHSSSTQPLPRQRNSSPTWTSPSQNPPTHASFFPPPHIMPSTQAYYTPSQWNTSYQFGMQQYSTQELAYLQGTTSYQPYANLRNYSPQPPLVPTSNSQQPDSNPPRVAALPTLPIHTAPETLHQESRGLSTTAVAHQPESSHYHIHQPRLQSQAPASQRQQYSSQTTEPPSAVSQHSPTSLPSKHAEHHSAEDDGLPEKYLVPHCPSKIPKPLPRPLPVKQPRKNALKSTVTKPPVSKKGPVTFQNRTVAQKGKEKCDSAIQTTPSPELAPLPEPTIYQPPPGTILVPCYQLELYQQEIEHLREQLRLATQPLQEYTSVGTMTVPVQTVEAGVGDGTVTTAETSGDTSDGFPWPAAICSPTTTDKENVPPNQADSEQKFQKRLKFVVEYLLNQSNPPSSSSTGAAEVVAQEDEQQQHQAKSAAYLGLSEETSVQVRAVLHKYQLEGSCLSTAAAATGGEMIAEVSSQLRHTAQTLRELTLLDHEDDSTFYVLQRHTQ